MEIPITCHSADQHYATTVDEWHAPRESEPYSYPFRTCSYCGSIHPEDLMKFFANGATAHGADWKYGWPHKFYIEGILNPIAGKTVRIGSESGPGYDRSIMGTASAHTPAKFYNKHLVDVPQAMFDELAILLEQQTGIKFVRDDAGISYSAPYRGYQR